MKAPIIHIDYTENTLVFLFRQLRIARAKGQKEKALKVINEIQNLLEEINADE